jgi:RNA polymerase sigma-70 factor, ECF subfamily
MIRVESSAMKTRGEGLLPRAREAPATTSQDKYRLFEQWALSQKDYLYTACFYLTRRHEDADDLFQETYLRAFRFFHQFTPGTNCRAWLLTIMHNTFRTRVTQRKEQVAADADLASHDYARYSFYEGHAGDDDPSATLLARSFDSEIRDALLALTEEYRVILLLVDIEEMTYDEAATVLACPVGTVRSRLSRARQALRERLTSYAREHGYFRERRSDDTGESGGTS